MSSLKGPLYSKIYRKVREARPTGTKTGVALFQQRVCVVVCPPGIYHVGLIVRDERGGVRHERILEHGPVVYDDATFSRRESASVFVPLPDVGDSIEDILEFERRLPKNYVIGVRDCRHHVLDLLEYLYGGNVDNGGGGN